jgi:hypothetical protein
MPSSTATVDSTRERIYEVLDDPANAGKSNVEIAELAGCNEGSVRRAKAARPEKPTPKATKPKAEKSSGEAVPGFKIKEQRKVEIAKLRLDLGTQMRGGNDQATIDHYADLRDEGHTFPEVDVFDDGKILILGHGHHRTLSAKQVGETHILANIYEGDIRAAMLFAVMSNRENPLSRTVQAKRNAVGTLLGDPEWSKFSLNKIAKTAGVSFAFAKQCEEAFQAARGGGVTVDPVKTVERNGVQYEMNTGAIGPRKKAGEREAGEDDEPEGPDAETAQRLQETTYLKSLPLNGELKGEAHSVFVEDALLYFRLEPGRADLECLFRHHQRKTASAQRGRYRLAVESFLKIKHPRYWLACLPCQATGAIGKACCNSCGGRGYHVEGLNAVQV